jgi:acetylornithine deacetylase/succinyl-diaminopimelate desuccinylase-like protein
VSRRGVIERVIRELASYERESASAGERRAAEWLAGELREAGCRAVRVEEERAHGGYWWPLGLLNAGSALAALLGRLPAALVGGAAAAAVYDDVSGGSLWFRRRALPHRPTWNVVA